MEDTTDQKSSLNIRNAETVRYNNKCSYKNVVCRHHLKTADARCWRLDVKISKK